MSEQPLLQVHNLKTYFYTEDGVMPSVDGVDFDLHEGETLAIVGESGCGKSVTSLSIMGLVQCPPGKIEAGEILYHGKDLLKISKKEMRSIRGNEISMIFQEPMTSLNPVFTVGRQIMESFIIHQKLNKKEARTKAIEMIRMVGIPDPEKVVDKYPHELSGGIAPTYYDCHGFGLQTAHPHCRRADHGFGCYNSSADHAVTERFERKNRHINHHYHT